MEPLRGPTSRSIRDCAWRMPVPRPQVTTSSASGLTFMIARLGRPALRQLSRGLAANWGKRFGLTRIGTFQEEPTGDGLGATLGTDCSCEITLGPARYARPPTSRRHATQPSCYRVHASFSCLRLRVESRNRASSASPRENLDASAASHSRFQIAAHATGTMHKPATDEAYAKAPAGSSVTVAALVPQTSSAAIRNTIT